MALSSNAEALTVFIATGAPEGVAVRDLMSSWTRSGILRPSLWVTPDDVFEDQPGPPRVGALIIGKNGNTPVDLFAAIGRERLELVRVVVANLVIDAPSAHGDVPRVGELIAHAIHETLPRRTGLDSVETGTRLQRTNSIIPVSGLTGVPESLLINGWDINTVVSPEDRPDLDRANIYVRHPENFSGHAAAAIAAMGGVLDGIDVGAIDDVHADSTTNENDIFVSRFTVRSVIGEDIFDDLVKATLDTRSFGGAGPTSALRNVRLAAHPRTIADAAAHFVLTSPEWAPANPPTSTAPSNKSQGFWSALWRAMKFNLRMFGVVMGWVLAKLRLRVEHKATDMIVGNESGISVTLGAGPADTLYVVAEEQLEANELRLKQQIETDSRYVAYPQASAWSILWRLTLGLADGGNLPTGFPEPRVSGAREALPLDSAVPNPRNRWTRADGSQFGPTDVVAEREHKADLQEEGDRLAEELKDFLGTQREVGRAIQAAKQALAAAKKESEKQARAKSKKATANAKAKANASTRSDDESDTAQDVVDEQSEAILAATNELAELARQASDLAAEIAALRSAIREHEESVKKFDAWLLAQASLVRSVIVGLVDHDEALAADASESTAALEDRPPRENLLRAQFTLKTTWSVIAIVWAVVCGLTALVVRLDGDVQLQDVWGVLATATGVSLVILLIANHGFFKAVQKYEWQVAQRLASQQNTADRAIYNRQETHRNAALHDGAQDWAVILGDVAHNPWHLTEPKKEELSADVINALPASMGVAELSATSSIPHHTLVTAARVAYHQGWLGDAFSTIYADFERIEPGSEGGYLSIEADTTYGMYSPRKRFIEFLATAESRQLATEKAVQRLRNAVDSEDVTLPMRQVTRMGIYSDTRSIDEDDFFRAAASESIALAKDAFNSRGLQSRLHYVNSSRAWLPGRVERSVDDPSLQTSPSTGANAVRVDLSRRVRPSDLALFGSEPANDNWTTSIPQVLRESPTGEHDFGSLDWR